jgi:hypothetical protein
MRVEIGHELTPNFVNAARERLLFYVRPVKSLRNTVDLRRLVGVVVGNGNGFLVDVQNHLRGTFPFLSVVFIFHTKAQTPCVE